MYSLTVSLEPRLLILVLAKRKEWVPRARRSGWPLSYLDARRKIPRRAMCIRLASFYTRSILARIPTKTRTTKQLCSSWQTLRSTSARQFLRLVLRRWKFSCRTASLVPLTIDRLLRSSINDYGGWKWAISSHRGSKLSPFSQGSLARCNVQTICCLRYFHSTSPRHCATGARLSRNTGIWSRYSFPISFPLRIFPANYRR
mmetsp:Transcript_6994/g.17338  ORF Transcript_6994/g.17338 Transcript_6994/m.17338 type:complete len:201 (+) Transcript_6994:405-1007(+)